MRSRNANSLGAEGAPGDRGRIALLATASRSVGSGPRSLADKVRRPGRWSRKPPSGWGHAPLGRVRTFLRRRTPLRSSCCIYLAVAVGATVGHNTFCFLSFFFFFNVFIYLTVLGLGCSIWDLCCSIRDLCFLIWDLALFTDSPAVVHGLSSPMTGGILLP